MLFLWILNTIIVNAFGKCSKSCESCHTTQPDELNVHIVAHTHLDVGWIKTFDEYYWGTKSKNNKSGVHYIIESVIIALMENSNRRFIFVETAYLHKWWNVASDNSKENLRALITNGQLEIVGGGWTMNDEACTNYQAIIDQFTIGLKFLNETFGLCAIPKTAWQVDTFGHSREMAKIFAEMSYEAIFIGRLDHQDRQQRFYSKTPELIWQTSSSLDSKIFVSIIFNGYTSPFLFCFDFLCNDNPIVDDDSSPEYNLDGMIARFAEYINIVASSYTTNHIMVAMGGDFHFQDALRHFSNLDKLIHGFKVLNHSFHGQRINLIYSTPNCYLKAIKKQLASNRQSYDIIFDDFFPYGSDQHSFWTGFYSSRPNSKRFERECNYILQITKQVTSFFPQIDDRIANLRPMQEALAIMQHHDAITGTEKQHVANDYHRLLTEAFEKNIMQTSDVLSILLPTSPLDDIDLNLIYCIYANVSICKLTQEEEFILAIYNPLSAPISHYIRLPVSSGCFTIFNSNERYLSISSHQSMISLTTKSIILLNMN
nr:lysosomal alpha-mannosidase-like [Onthophagus taurus]